MIGALNLIADHESAVRVECLRYGRSIDDIGPTFTWADVIAICEHTVPGTPLHRAVNPDDGMWDHQSMLLADIVDAVRVLAWQNAGGKKKDRPQPIPRPGVVEKQTKQFGSQQMEITDMQEWLARKRRGG